jgi:hypothetical protein
MTAPLVSAFYGGLLGLIGLFLAILVVRGRVMHRVDIGDGGKPEMQRATRVFANFAEYVPFIVVLMGLGEMLGAPKTLTHALGIGLVAGRLFHAYGLSQSSGRSIGRFVGTNLTWIALLVASGWLVWAARGAI